MSKPSKILIGSQNEANVAEYEPRTGFEEILVGKQNICFQNVGFITKLRKGPSLDFEEQKEYYKGFIV